MSTQTTWADARPGFKRWRDRASEAVSLQRRPFIFGSLVAYFLLYYYRPEDFVKPLGYIPMAKVAALFAFGGLIFGMSGAHKVKVPKAIKLLWLLVLQMTICIPFAIWPGGAYTEVFGRYVKGVVVAMLISMVVVSLEELRRLLWIQVSAVTLVTFLSMAMRHYQDGRLSGIQQSILENPNDLAINIAIAFPLALAFLLRARAFKKIIWALGLGIMCVGVVLTSSRSGLLALIVSIVVSVWQFGIKGKRRRVVVATMILMVLGFLLAISNSHYRKRVESIVLGKVQGLQDSANGSIEARKELLKLSVMTALTHPVFGVGPGCFPLLSGFHVAHNAYTEMAAESGILALILFLMALYAAYKNLRDLQKSRRYLEDPEFALLTQALCAGLAAYLAGSCFASTEYNLYAYLVMSYSCAMVRIASGYVPTSDDKPASSGLRKLEYAGRQRPRTAWSS
jgi:O-antigen ligase